MTNLYPDVKAPDGMAYAWKRVALAGEIDTKNVAKMWSDGWRAVPLARHPEFESSDPKHIIVGGLILCERSAEIEAAARAALTKAADDAYNAAAANLEAAIRARGGEFEAPRSVNGVVVMPKKNVDGH